MNYKKQNIENYLLYDTPVENIFISEYMADARGEYVKQYLLALMYAQMQHPFDNHTLAKELGCSLELVLEGWDYWESKGIVEKNIIDSSNPDNFEVTFINLREGLFSRRSKTQTPPISAQLDDKILSRLFKDVERTCGRLLEAREAEQISAWISEYNISPEMILFGYQYSAENRKSTRFRYVGEILKDWRAKGLEDKAHVEEYLKETDKHYDLYKKIFKELGFHRSPTEQEKRLMNTWIDKYGFEIDKICEACKKTSGISNPNINYVNSVLESWYKEEHKAAEPVTPESVFVRVSALYEKIREENENKTKENRKRIITEIPRISDIMSEIHDAGIRIAKLALTGSPEAVKQQKRRMAELYAERARLLTQHGYAETAMDAVYTCPGCKDTGVLEDGSRCSCYEEKVAMLQK